MTELQENINRVISKLDSFKLYLQSKGLAARTVYTYAMVLGKFIDWHEVNCGGFDVNAVTPLDVADYKSFLQNQGKKPATINHALDILDTFFSWLLSQGVILHNPASTVKKVANKEMPPNGLIKETWGH